MASKENPTSTTDLTKSYLGKRRHSDSEDTLTGESSDNNSPPRSFTVKRTSSESSEIQSQTSSNASPIDHIPKETRDWTEETIFNNLQIKDMLSPSPLDVFNNGYVDCFLKNHAKVRDYMLKVDKDQQHRSKHDCYAFALNKAFDVDCSVLSDVTISKVLQLTEEFKKPFEDSCFARWLFVNEKHESKDMRNICENIYPRLQQFCEQLLVMVECTHTSQNSDNLTEAMYQELFVTFLRIFGVTVIAVPNLRAYHLTIGDRIVTSIPDAVVCRFVRNGEEVNKKVIAVVEVKKNYTRHSNLEIVRQTRNSERKTSVIKHIDSGLKGQHAGEMLAVIPSSVFDSNGIYGIIVQGTMITFVSLATSQEYCKNLNEGKMKNCHATIKYSNAVNMLSTKGRQELVSTFLGMSTLLDCMSQELMN